MIETYPLERAGEVYARMMSGKAQFRVVLTMWCENLSVLDVQSWPARRVG
jgi:hypothetical protein